MDLELSLISESLNTKFFFNFTDYYSAITDGAVSGWRRWGHVSGVLNIHSKPNVLFVGDVLHSFYHVWCYGINEPLGSRPGHHHHCIPCGLHWAFRQIPNDILQIGCNFHNIYYHNLTLIFFSVDFSAHISYHFMKYQDLSQDERVKETLYTLGLPIVQGATSSCLGVLGLGFVPLYIYQTFMKMVSLAVVIGAIHGIVFLPVFLSLTMGSQCQSKKKTNM